MRRNAKHLFRFVHKITTWQQTGRQIGLKYTETQLGHIRTIMKEGEMLGASVNKHSSQSTKIHWIMTK